MHDRQGWLKQPTLAAGRRVDESEDRRGGRLSIEWPWAGWRANAQCEERQALLEEDRRGCVLWGKIALADQARLIGRWLR